MAELIKETIGDHGTVTVEEGSGVTIYNFDYDGVCMWIDTYEGPHINEFLCSRDNAVRMFGLTFDVLKTVPSLPVTICGKKPNENLLFRARLEDHNLTVDGLKDVLESLMKLYEMFTDWTVRVREMGKREHCCAYEFQYF